MRGTRREVLAGAAAATWLATTPAFASRSSGSMNVISDGHSLHVSREPGAKPGSAPVIYVHGATFPSSLAVGWRFADGRSWADNLVDAGFDVWSFDFIGYGKSDRYPAMTQEPVPGALGRSDTAVRQLAAVVARVRAETGRKVSLLAHSWGTIIAARLAAERPADIDRLVLFGPILQRQGGDASGIDRLFGWDTVTLAAQISRFREDVPEGEPELITDAMFAPWGAAYLATDDRASRRVPPAVAVPTGPVADILAARAGMLPYEPARIMCPVAVVRGAWDSRVTDSDVAGFKAALANCPSFTDAKLERGTHLMHLESGRARLWAATRNALAEVKRTPVDTHAVIFEVHPSEDGRGQYLATAAALRPLLDEIDGFVSIERFQSITRPGWILSLSFWADEAAIAAWRSRERHHEAQSKGRTGIFENYRLRVAHTLFDGGVDHSQQPQHPSSYRDPARRRIDHLGLVETIGTLPPALADVLEGGSGFAKVEAFTSLTTAGKTAHLITFDDAKAAQSCRATAEQAIDVAANHAGHCRVWMLEVLRDYGMFDRAEAPQFHPEIRSVKTAA
jgi:pimeloyl-ACP methyl ester carboxylesterase/heme-degrading monooxygenase HmoA